MHSEDTLPILLLFGFAKGTFCRLMYDKNDKLQNLLTSRVVSISICLAVCTFRMFPCSTEKIETENIAVPLQPNAEA